MPDGTAVATQLRLIGELALAMQEGDGCQISGIEIMAALSDTSMALVRVDKNIAEEAYRAFEADLDAMEEGA